MVQIHGESKEEYEAEVPEEEATRRETRALLKTIWESVVDCFLPGFSDSLTLPLLDQAPTQAAQTEDDLF